EPGDLLGSEPRVGGVERRPNGPGRDRVDANASREELLSERAREGVDRTFARGVVGEAPGAEQAGLGPRGDDGTARSEVGQACLDEEHVAEDVRAEGVLE